MSGKTLEKEADTAVCHSTSSFRSERWDRDTAEDSQEQWERPVWECQKLTLIERWPYQLRAEFESTPPYSPPENGEEIRRVHGWQTVWLRTCYDPDLASKYEEMKQRSEVPGSGVPEDKVLGPCLLQFRRRQRGLMASSAGVNLLDREAIESGLIRILWLDEHGNIVWDNRLDPFRTNLDGLAGALLSSITLGELANWNGTRGAEVIR
ncbi:hypothetical protein ALT_8130 [Aspergillus lentulus]|uniref:Uncharacterized protein n=1 Tax=Aspergillus lentulus TaxID=293939 RepID=A0AAN4PR87_ASPLE|nr:hypothetical protein ALT_8130 [Aspergillus lentulus]